MSAAAASNVFNELPSACFNYAVPACEPAMASSTTDGLGEGYVRVQTFGGELMPGAFRRAP